MKAPSTHPGRGPSPKPLREVCGSSMCCVHRALLPKQNWEGFLDKAGRHMSQTGSRTAGRFSSTIVPWREEGCPWHSGLWQSGFVIPFPQADKQLIVLRKQLHLGRFSFWVWQHREALPSIRPEALPSPGLGEVSWQGLGCPGRCSKSGASNSTVYIQFSRSGGRHGLGSFAEAPEEPLFLAMPWAELSSLGLCDWMSTSRLAVRWGCPEQSEASLCFLHLSRCSSEPVPGFSSCRLPDLSPRAHSWEWFFTFKDRRD